jgi:hypothetical protein
MTLRFVSTEEWGHLYLAIGAFADLMRMDSSALLGDWREWSRGVIND